jgi:hypothetical protein
LGSGLTRSAVNRDPTCVPRVDKSKTRLGGSDGNIQDGSAHNIESILKKSFKHSRSNKKSISSDLADIFLMLAVLTLAEQDSGLLSTEGGRSKIARSDTCFSVASGSGLTRPAVNRDPTCAPGVDKSKTPKLHR